MTAGKPRGSRDRVWAAVALAALSGVGVACSFPPADQSWLVWVALVPLLWVVMHSRGPLRAALLGCAGGLACGMLVLNPLVSAHLWTGWSLLPTDQLEVMQARQYWFLRLLWVVLSLVIALFWGGFAAALQALCRGDRRLVLVAAPCLWVLGPEWLRSLVGWGFHWSFLGNATSGLAPIRQLAAVGGVWLLSALVVLVNAAIATSVQRQAWRKAVLAPLLVAGVVAVAWVGGAWRVHRLSSITACPFTRRIASEGQTATHSPHALHNSGKTLIMIRPPGYYFFVQLPHKFATAYRSHVWYAANL